MCPSRRWIAQEKTNEHSVIVTRIAIVAESEGLRRSLAAALGESAAFDVVSTTASTADASDAAEVVLLARPPRSVRRVVDATRTAPPALSNREREILALFADGLANKQIAVRLDIAPSTVKTHVEQLFEKLGVGTRTEAVAEAVRRGLLLL